MAAKFRHPGWVCVAPTPSTQPCDEEGRSARRDVDPRKTILTVGALEEGCIEDLVQPHPHSATSATHPISALSTRASARRGLRGFAGDASVVAFTVYRRYLRAHRAEVHRELSAMMDRVIQSELDVDHRGKLKDPAEVHRLDQLFA